MRSTLLITTAALLAGVAMASAQSMPGGGRESGAAQSPGAQSGGAAQDRQSPQRGAHERGQNRQGQAQDHMMQRGQKDQTTGQATQHENGAQGKAGQREKAQPQRSERNRDQTTGQGQREQSQSPSQTQQSPTQGQSPQRQQGQQGQPGQPGAAAPGQAREGQTGGNVSLTTEQRTTIRQKVLAGGNVPRVGSVNFAVRVGTVVPTSVRVVEVPPALIEIHPDWRGHMYFVVGDEIIIVDRSHRIIAVIAV